MKIVIVIASLVYRISYRYLKPFMSYRDYTSGRQLKIIFLEVLDYSEYSYTNISKKKMFHKNIASSVRKQKV